MSASSETNPEQSTPPRYERRKIPLLELITSLLGFGPIRFRWVIRIQALVKEQHRIGRYRPAGVPSNRELEVKADGARRAKRGRDKCLRRINALTAQLQNLQARILALETAARSHQRDPVTGPYGEPLTLQMAIEREAVLRVQVEVEAEAGSMKHRRVSAGMKRAPWLAPPIDIPVLAYFLGELFNVDWLNPADQPAQFGAAVVFSILGTVGVALGLRSLGRTLRAHKNDAGQLKLPKGSDGIIPALELTSTAAALVGAGVVMAFRIIGEAGPNTMSTPAAVLLGIFFAIITIIVNWTVFAAEFRDGSMLTEQIDKLSSKIAKSRDAEQRAASKACRLQSKVSALYNERQKVAASGLATVDDSLKAADQLILVARSYHVGTGYSADLADSIGDDVPSGLIEPHVGVDVSLLEMAVGLIKDPSLLDISPDLSSQQGKMEGDRGDEAA